jgi:Zn ribbon nucleic-acid-binding protein
MDTTYTELIVCPGCHAEDSFVQVERQVDVDVFLPTPVHECHDCGYRYRLVQDQPEFVAA